MKEYNFNVYAKDCEKGLCDGLCALITAPPVFVCIGSDAVAGDSLSPLVGSFLKETYNVPCFIYGDLSKTMTAREMPLLSKTIRALHPKNPVVAIDAGVGDESEIGLIRLREGGLYPGKGVGKSLAPIGDYSLLGVVSRRGKDAFSQLELTRFHLVYRMAAAMAAAINGFCSASSLFGGANFVGSFCKENEQPVSATRGLEPSALCGLESSALRGLEPSALRGVEPSASRGLKPSALRGVEPSALRAPTR
ncbi:MAG: spore protease YyaC [Clostridia bacterium]|nr:spore protease YyaC [Clostridia bacterium]